MLHNLLAKKRLWNVNRYEAKRSKHSRGQNLIALGFAWSAANIGGVRRHLECIEKYSSFPVALYPSTYACDQLPHGSERNSYHEGINDSLINRHSLFHSHVDPRFILAAQQGQKRGRPWVHTYHALYFSEDWDNKLAPWQKEINDCLVHEARRADCCLAINSWLVDWLDVNHGIKARFIPNGVDVKACDQAVGERFINLNAPSEFALFVGSSLGVKNPLAFIEVADRFPTYAFVMIGTGLTQSNIEKSFGIKVPTNLKLLGPLPHDKTLDAIAACQTLVMTSHREGLPTVLLEAMAMKKPCVVPDAPWFADAIETDAHGLKYEPGNLDDLSEKIETACKLGTLDTARERVEDKFSWPVVIDQLDEIYRRLLS